MKKLTFLTGEDLLDVDLPIVEQIHTNYQFTWIIVLKGYGWFESTKLENFCAKNEIKLILFHQTFKLKDPRTLFFHIKLLRFLKTLNSDLIYDSYLGVPYMHYFTSLFLKRAKFVIAIHDVRQHHKMANRFIRSTYYNYIMKMNANIHLFSVNQLEIFSTRFKQKNILLAPLSLKDFGAPQIARETDSKKTNFLFFGIIRENKGINLIIEAVNNLIGKYENMQITIAGKSANGTWEKYVNLIDDETVYNLEIRTIKNEEVADLLTKADFLLLPYLDVTQSGVLLTAYNYGLPVIASNLDGFNEYVENGKTGYLCDVNDHKSLKRAMEKAVDMSADEYNLMRMNVKKYAAEEISAKSISTKYTTYFNKLLE